MNTGVVETGYLKPLENIMMENKGEITDVIVIVTYHTLIKVKVEIDQFISGLQCLGVHSCVMKHPKLMKPLFVEDASNMLTAGYC